MEGLADGRSTYRAAFFRGLRPDPYLNVAEWADQYRFLSSVDTDEHGPWKTSRTPYLREIMEKLSPHDPCKEVYFMKGTQLGATQCGNNWIGAKIATAPGPIMIVMPTVEMAKRNSNQRIQTMIDHCPALREKIKPSRSRDSGNTMLSKRFEGGVLVMTGANSAVGLRSFSARDLMGDELDGWPADCDGEGDPWEIAKRRTSNFQRRKIFGVSTPTEEDVSRIDREYQRGTQKLFYLPCPLCGTYQEIEFGGKDQEHGLKWYEGKEAEAFYVCLECAQAIQHHRKTEMLEEGEWTPHNDQPDPFVESYHLSSLYSPVGWYSWGDAALQWRRAQGNPLKLKTFVNTVLGQTSKIRGEAPSDEALMRLREQYPQSDTGRRDALGTPILEDAVPVGCCLLTAGVDVQADRLEVTVWGWGRGEEVWKIRHQVLRGDPTALPVWEMLWQFLTRPWVMERGGVDYIRSTCVDAGYASQQVYAFVGPREVYQTPEGGEGSLAYLWAIQGSAGKGTVWPDKAARTKTSKRAGAAVYTIKSDTAKQYMHARAQARINGVDAEGNAIVPGPGYFHLGMDTDENWCRQFTAEHCILRTTPRGYPERVWELRPGRQRNEGLDCAAYGYAALCALYSLGMIMDSACDAAESRTLPMPAASQMEHLATHRPPAPKAEEATPEVEPEAHAPRFEDAGAIDDRRGGGIEPSPFSRGRRPGW